MKKLKITQAGWDGYTGFLGPIMFTNGISDEPVGRQVANQLTASISMVEIDEEGNEAVAGITQGMVEGKFLAVPDDTDALARMTQEERDEEIKRDRAKSKIKPKPAIAEFHTSESLMKIADEKGIQGIREAAKPWGVKERSIPKLITMILEAQADYQKAQSGEALVKGATEVSDVVIEGEEEGDPGFSAPTEVIANVEPAVEIEVTNARI